MNPVDPQLESAWFEPLKLKCEKLVSTLCFHFNLYHYLMGIASANLDATNSAGPVYRLSVGLYK